MPCAALVKTTCRGALCLTQYCCHPLKIVKNFEQGILHLFLCWPWTLCSSVRANQSRFFSRFLSLWIHSSFRCVTTMSFLCARRPRRPFVFLYLWLASVSGRRILSLFLIKICLWWLFLLGILHVLKWTSVWIPSISWYQAFCCEGLFMVVSTQTGKGHCLTNPYPRIFKSQNPECLGVGSLHSPPSVLKLTWCSL